MADLSAYIDFSVELDFNANQIKVTDTGTYPVGVPADLIGILTITQPDGVEIQGEWTAPEVYYDSGSLVQAVRTLRLTSDAQPQQGTYTIKYEVDHPDYVPTTLTKSFELAYTRKTLDLVEDFDVFTPSLFYRDNTNFAQTGWTLDSAPSDWTAQIGSVGTTTSGSVDFDLVYGGNYYDALYEIEYQRLLVYSHQTYDYLTLRDLYTRTINTQADTPPTVNQIIECLNDLKAERNAAAGSCQRTDLLEAKYQKAMARYDHLIHKLRIGDADDAETLLDEIIDITGCSHGVFRNTPIQPYDLSAYTASSGGDATYNYTLPSDLTEVTLAALNDKIITSIDMDGTGRQFSSGADGDTPATGQFIVVTGSAPRKFKFGGTMMEGQWLRIKYQNA